MREAVALADGGSEPACSPDPVSPPTTIELPAGTYTLGVSGLTLSADATIVGSGRPIISGGGIVQVLTVTAGAHVELSGVTITDGLSGVPTTGCQAGSCPPEKGSDGGGIANAGALTITDSTIAGNRASPGTAGYSLETYPPGRFPGQPGFPGGSGGFGGGISNTGTLLVESSVLSANEAGSGASGTPGASGEQFAQSPGETGGNGGDGGVGGAIFNSPGASLTVVNCSITGNAAGAGGDGGAGSAATVSGANGGNGGDPGAGGSGGGIYSEGTATIVDSTISGNETGRGGDGAPGGEGRGGSAGAATSGEYGGAGGGVAQLGEQPLALTNDTVAGNVAAAGGDGAEPGPPGVGGGVYSAQAGVKLSFDTIASNTAAGAGGGVSGGGPFVETASVIASNAASSPANCQAAVADGGENLTYGDPSCPGANADPKLVALAANGGLSATMALGPGSPAIDHVPASACSLSTDERGLARPFGAACDSGAYENAPPTITGVAAQPAGASDAEITATIDPDLSALDTRVVVRYGTNPSYGTETPAEDLGRGGAGVAYSTHLSGLGSHTVYDYAVVATNADGTTTANGAFSTGGTASSTIAPLRAALTSLHMAGPTALAIVNCSGGPARSVCEGPITVAAQVTRRGRSIVAVSAATRDDRRGHVKLKTRHVVVATGRYSVASGHTGEVPLRLTPEGAALLDSRLRLPVAVTLGTTGTGRATFALRLQAVRARILARWIKRAGATELIGLSVSRVPSGARVSLLCHGPGCPFVRRTLRSRDGRVRFTQRLTFSATPTLSVEVTHLDELGEATTYRLHRGHGPTRVAQCVDSGTGRARSCTRPRP